MECYGGKIIHIAKLHMPSGWWRLPVRDADQRFRAAGAHQGRGQLWSVVPRDA
jgi:hypothetical protein